MRAFPVLAVLAACVGWSVAAGLAPAARPGFGAAVAVLAALEATVSRAAVDAGEGTIRGWRRLELVVALVGVPLLSALSGGMAEGPVTAEVVTGWLLALVVWVLVQSTLGDLSTLERGLGRVDGPAPLTRVWFRFVAAGTAVSVFSALGAVGLTGLVELDRPGLRSLLVAPLLYFLAGTGGIGALAWVGERARWERDGAQVDPAVGRRWTEAVLLVVVAAFMVGALVPLLVPGVTAIPLRMVLAIDPSADFLGDLGGGTEQEALPGPGNQPRPAPASASEEGSEGRVPPWLGEAVFIVLAGLVFLTAVSRARSRRRRRLPEEHPLRWGRLFPDLARSLGAVLRSLWGMVKALWEMLRAALGALVRLGARHHASPPDGAGEHLPGNAAGVPGDSGRGRVVAAYRRFVASAAAVVGERRRSETAAEFSRRAAPLLTARGALFRLTRLYELARYGQRQPELEDVESAERSADRLIEDLGRRREGHPPGRHSTSAG